METYLITGKNNQGESGSWEIKTENKKALKKILLDRGVQAKTINGETVKRTKSKTLKEID